MLLNDQEIRQLCRTSEFTDKPMISPFEDGQIKNVEGARVISYGTSSFGYDMRVSDEFKLFTNTNATVVDPKAFDPRALIDATINEDGSIIIPPNSFTLCRSLEYFQMPEDVLAICLGKSTYARCGLVVNVTPLEPGWTGHLTIEISNTTTLPVKVYVREGIAQLLFFRGNKPLVTYADRGGKYMGQEGVTNPKV